MKVKLTLALLFLFLKITLAQIVVVADKNTNNFYGYDLVQDQYLDFRIDTSPNSMDEYISIAKINEHFAYVGLIKVSNNGVRKPMIIKFNFQNLSHEEIITEDIELPICIDIDPINNKIYWIDKDRNELRRANLDGSEAEFFGEVEEVTASRLPKLAVDKKVERIFFSNGAYNFFLTNSDDYAPAELTSIFKETPINGVHNGARIGDMVIPENGEYLFWSNNTNDSDPHLIKRDLTIGTGGGEVKIFELENSVFNELAVLNDRLYWSGGYSELSSIDLNGNDYQEYVINRNLFDFIVLEEVVSSTENIAHSFPIIVGPNPVVNLLRLSLPHPNEKYTYSIINGNGTTIINKAILHSPQIETSHLPRGSYILQLENEKGASLSRKFFK